MEHDYSSLFSTAYTFIGWLLMFVIVWFVTRSKGLNLSNSITNASPRLRAANRLGKKLSDKMSRSSRNRAMVSRRLFCIHKKLRAAIKIIDLYMFENPSDSDVKEIKAKLSPVEEKLRSLKRGFEDRLEAEDVLQCLKELDEVCVSVLGELDEISSKYRKK